MQTALSQQNFETKQTKLHQYFFLILGTDGNRKHMNMFYGAP